MIVSNARHAEHNHFEKLLESVMEHLNNDANNRADYYATRDGIKLEEDVFKLLEMKAKGTIFENTIEMISGQKFPDIIAKGYYGVEVKTTKGNAWTSTGSSIVESTRVDGIEKIYLLFGKLSNPISFRVKPYEACLSDIVVTHSPRYKIDMNLVKEETIFHKMAVNYDEFRINENSLAIVKEYYKRNLKPGQNLWWIDAEPIDEQAVSPIIKMWNTLDKREKKALLIKGLCWFPEVFGNNTLKFNRLAIWLVTQKGVVTTSLRDIFTAGGRIDIKIADKEWKNQPQIFGKIADLHKEIISEIKTADISWIREFWEIDSCTVEERIDIWINLVVEQLPENKDQIRKMLSNILDV